MDKRSRLPFAVRNSIALRCGVSGACGSICSEKALASPSTRGCWYAFAACRRRPKSPPPVAAAHHRRRLGGRAIARKQMLLLDEVVCRPVGRGRAYAVAERLTAVAPVAPEHLGNPLPG